MTSRFKSLGIHKLSLAERLVLVEDIWDSIAAEEPEVELTDEMKRELDRRIEAADANPGAGSSWEEVKARLRAKR
jgi:putative addiction module component (TIGR02574 family)